VEGSATVNLVGSALLAKVSGDVAVNVSGSGVQWGGFVGEENGGEITGELLLQVFGDPQLAEHGVFRGSVNRASFGEVKLYASLIAPARFVGFAGVTQLDEPGDPDPDPDPDVVTSAMLQVADGPVYLPDPLLFSFRASVAASDKANVLQLTFDYDASRFRALVAPNLSDLDINSYDIKQDDSEQETGRISVLLGVTGSKIMEFDNAELLTIRLEPLDTETAGIATLTLSSLSLLGKDELDPLGTSPIAMEYSSEPLSITYYPESFAAPGDLNWDGFVDAADLSLALYYYGAAAGDDDWESVRAGDSDASGVIDMADINTLIQAIHSSV
jgi:hypothetical protein